MKKETRTYSAAGAMLMIIVLALMIGQHAICFNDFLQRDVYYYLWVIGLGAAQALILVLVKGAPEWAYRYLCRFYILAAVVGIVLSDGVLKYVFIALDFFGAYYTGSAIRTPGVEK